METKFVVVILKFNTIYKLKDNYFTQKLNRKVFEINKRKNDTLKTIS